MGCGGSCGGGCGGGGSCGTHITAPAGEATSRAGAVAAFMGPAYLGPAYKSIMNPFGMTRRTVTVQNRGMGVSGLGIGITGPAGADPGTLSDGGKTSTGTSGMSEADLAVLQNVILTGIAATTTVISAEQARARADQDAANAIAAERAKGTGTVSAPPTTTNPPATNPPATTGTASTGLSTGAKYAIGGGVVLFAAALATWAYMRNKAAQEAAGRPRRNPFEEEEHEGEIYDLPPPRPRARYVPAPVVRYVEVVPEYERGHFDDAGEYPTRGNDGRFVRAGGRR